MKWLFGFLTVSIILAASNAPAAIECTELCATTKSRLKSSAKDVEIDQQLWERRLNTKAEVIRYSGGYSAAESLLDYMASYERKSRLDDNTRASLMFVMAKCFPESYVNAEEARLSGLVNTLWAARHTKVAASIVSCQ